MITCPCPKEIVNKLVLLIPLSAAKRISPFIGSDPADKMKTNGEQQLLSLYDSSMLN